MSVPPPELPSSPTGDVTKPAESRVRRKDWDETGLEIGIEAFFVAAVLAQYAICIFGGFWATGGNLLGSMALGVALYTGRWKAHAFTVMASSILLFVGRNSMLSAYLRQLRTGETMGSSPQQRRKFTKATRQLVVGGFFVTLLAALIHMAVLLLLTVPVAIGFAVYSLSVPELSAWGVTWRLFAVSGAASLLCWPALNADVDWRG